MSSSPQTLNDLADTETIVRRARTADIDAVIHLAKRIPTAAQWTPVEYASYGAAEQQGETQAKIVFVACAPPQRDPVFLRKQIVGFAAFSAIPHVGGGECEIENMAVAEAWRRQGIAGRLLAAGLLWCRAWCPAGRLDARRSSGLSLEVRAKNLTAIAFYERAGFQTSGRRPAYYRQPDDDAILMWKSLNPTLETF